MNSRTVQLLLLYGALLGIASLLLAPFAWLLSTALKAESADLFAFPPQWIPDQSCGAILLKRGIYCPLFAT